MSVNYIDIKEFRELGYLQEVNRRFLHPLGLALEIKQHDDGRETLGGIWDYRDDPEGMNFAPHAERQEERDRKAAHIDKEWEDRQAARVEALGYWIQPIEDI